MMFLSGSQLSQALNELPTAGIIFYQGMNGQIQDVISRWDVRGEKTTTLGNISTILMSPNPVYMPSEATLLQEYFPLGEERGSRPLALKYLKGDGCSWKIRLTNKEETLQYEIVKPAHFSGSSLPFTYQRDKRLFVPD